MIDFVEVTLTLPYPTVVALLNWLIIGSLAWVTAVLRALVCYPQAARCGSDVQLWHIVVGSLAWPMLILEAIQHSRRNRHA